MYLFEPQEPSPAEQLEIARLLSQPVIKKYLKFLGQAEVSDLARLGTLDMPKENLANRHNLITGKLSVIETLLSIQPPK